MTSFYIYLSINYLGSYNIILLTIVIIIKIIIIIIVFDFDYIFMKSPNILESEMRR